MIYIDLKRLRADKDAMTQTELASRLGCKQAYISQIEIGARHPSEWFIERIKTAFGDVSEYISDIAPSREIVQRTKNGDNVGGDKILIDGKPLDREDEIVRLTAMLEQARNEIAWLRGMVEKLSKTN